MKTLLQMIKTWWNAPLLINGQKQTCAYGGKPLMRKDWLLGKVVDVNGFGDFAHLCCAEAHDQCGLMSFK